MPTSLSEKEFWTKYFQSGYYYNSQGKEKPKNIPNDPLFDAMEKSRRFAPPSSEVLCSAADEIGPDVWTAESMVNPEVGRVSHVLMLMIGPSQVDLTQAEMSTGHAEHSVEMQPLPGDAFASNGELDLPGLREVGRYPLDTFQSLLHRFNSQSARVTGTVRSALFYPLLLNQEQC